MVSANSIAAIPIIIESVIWYIKENPRVMFAHTMFLAELILF